jgi:hypothetical protein
MDPVASALPTILDARAGPAHRAHAAPVGV